MKDDILSRGDGWFASVDPSIIAIGLIIVLILLIKWKPGRK